MRDELLFVRRGTHREREAAAEARSVLMTFGLDAFADVPVNRLSYGQRKMVELARAWAARPALLLLDEPTAGLNGVEIARLQSKLSMLRRERVLTMLVITHHIEFLVGMADTITVLDLGRPIAEGPPERIRADPAVVSAYLGAD
jgi:branched-chain amino acid transport system ATP-binding protein